jgi:hypothetical protein
MEILERLFNKVKENNGCWEFLGASRQGYGSLKVSGKVIDTHRLSWIMHNGPIPSGMYVCHKCDNPKCVNPEHLFLGTHSDNMKDAYKKGRVSVEGVKFTIGHKPVNRRLNDDQVREVKDAIIKRGSETLKQISSRLNIPYDTIRDISCGRAY